MNNEVQQLPTMPLWPGGAPYANGASEADQPAITAYLPAGTAPTAAVVVCPGGAYAFLAPHEAEPIARWLCSIGVAGLVVRYRVKPYLHPIPSDDVRRAIRFTRANARAWNIDPNRVGVLGFSAGGHVAATVGTIHYRAEASNPDPIDRLSARPDAMILCYPVLSFGKYRHDGTMRNLLGERPDPRMRRHLSLEFRVNEKTPPTFLWHTVDDTAAPVENSLIFAEALKAANVPFALHLFPTGAHGLGLADNTHDVRQWTQLAAEWFKRIGFRT